MLKYMKKITLIQSVNEYYENCYTNSPKSLSV